MLLLFHFRYCSSVTDEEAIERIRNACNEYEDTCIKADDFYEEFDRFSNDQSVTRTYDWYLKCEEMVTRTDRLKNKEIIVEVSFTKFILGAKNDISCREFFFPVVTPPTVGMDKRYLPIKCPNMPENNRAEDVDEEATEFIEHFNRDEDRQKEEELS